MLYPDWLTWFGSDAWVSLASARQLEPFPRLSLFAVLPGRNEWIEALYWIFLSSALMLTFGFLTRLNSVIVFVCLNSIQQRNLYITHGGDTFLRVCGFFLIFAPCGCAISIDRLVRMRRGKQNELVQPRAPWAQRMIQFQLAVLYVAGCWSKLQGAPWRDGTALYYVYHLDEIRRFPVPAAMLDPTVLRFCSWGAMALELFLGILIWFKMFRYWLLFFGLLFHLCLEYSLNIPLFQWDVLSAYVLFLDSKDILKAGEWTRRRLALLQLKLAAVFHKQKSRPTLEASGIEVITVLHQGGWPADQEFSGSQTGRRFSVKPASNPSPRSDSGFVSISTPPSGR